MNKIQKQEVKCLLKAYKTIGKYTPIKADCGRLCDAACCKSNKDLPEESGMLLFPGENLIFAPFLKKELIGFHNKPTYWATCKGRCSRILRPLSCRIFPLFPYVKPEDRHLDKEFIFTIILDPRAKFLCPLIAYGDCVETDFKNQVKQAIFELGKSNEMKEFIFRLSETADDYLKFTGS